MKRTDKEIIEAMTFIKDQHNGELPYVFGTLECANMMAKYLIKQLDMRIVGVTFKDKKIPAFNDWLYTKGYTTENNYIFKSGKFYSLKSLELKYKKDIEVKP